MKMKQPFSYFILEKLFVAPLLNKKELFTQHTFSCKYFTLLPFSIGSLGAVKTRGILPWEAGDIDILMNVTKKLCFDTLRTEFVKQHPDYIIVDHNSNEIIIQPKRGFGGWVTIFFKVEEYPLTKTMRMNLDGYWVSVSYYMFRNFRRGYGLSYLQHKMYNEYGKSSVHCIEKSNACLPDFIKLFNGRGGMWKEYFREQN